MKVYSGINELPRAKAKKDFVDGCLALEGGAFRGVYTSGVLDFLMEQGLNFTTTIGISAGALNGLNYVSGDIGRSALCNLKHRHDSRWVGLKALSKNNGIMGFDFLTHGLEEEYHFDKDFFLDSRHHLIALATNINTGKVEAFDSQKFDFDTMFKAVAASASMPFVSKPVQIGNKYYLDGGCASKLPLRYALTNKFTKIVLVTTRETSYRRKEKTKQSKILKLIYKKYPNFRNSYMSTSRLYNEDCTTIDKLVKEGKIFLIAPSQPVTVKRLESDMEKLGELYHLGYNDAKNKYEALLSYLENH